MELVVYELAVVFLAVGLAAYAWNIAGSVPAAVVDALPKAAIGVAAVGMTAM